MNSNEDAAPDPFRRISGALLGTAAWVAGGWAWRALLIARWGFDPIVWAHWQAVGSQISLWWRGQVPGISVLFFATLLLFPVLIALIARALARRGLSKDNMFVTVALFFARILAWCARPVTERLRERVEIRRDATGARAAPVAPPARPEGADPPLPTPVAADEPAPAPPAAPQAAPARSAASMTVGEDIPENDEDASHAAEGGDPDGAADERTEQEAPVTIDDLTSKVMLWLRDNGWDYAPLLHVDADRAAASFKGDPMDNDPTAVIPLAAFSANEIYLLRLVDLDGLDWEAAACDRERRGIPAWRSVDEDEALQAREIDCPFSLALRDRERFLGQHGTYIDFMGYGTGSVNAGVITVSGGIVNHDRVMTEWERHSLIHLALDGSTDLLASMFGEPVDKSALNPEVVAEIAKASGEIEKDLRNRAA